MVAAVAFHAPFYAEPGAAAAASAGLRYVSDTEPGWTRKPRGKGWSFHHADGSRVANRGDIRRIKALAIPPAWTSVWICPDPNGHIQATGRDARGRKQYRYHARWRAIRDEAKFDRTRDFGEALPLIRERVERDLALDGLPREKVLAAVVALLDATHARVGNDEYARENGHYGLTTLRNQHASVRKGVVRLRYIGKTGKPHDLAVDDPALARVVKACQELPGQVLFQHEASDGSPRRILSQDVNDYLRETMGHEYTAKDFRTWAGTRYAAAALAAMPREKAITRRKRQVNEAIRSVAARLHNTPAVCRKCYVHPAVIDAHLRGKRPRRSAARSAADSRFLAEDERAVLALLN